MQGVNNARRRAPERPRRRRVMAIALSLSLLPLASVGGASAVEEARSRSGVQQQQTVTLITGEQVIVTTLPGGQVGYTVVPLEGVPNGDVVQMNRNGDRYVVPSYVLQAGDEKLDLELFNVSALIREGYDDDSAETLPTIVEFTRSARQVESLDQTRAYGLLPAAAAEQPRDEAEALGRALAEHAEDPSAPDPLAGVEQVWLDGRVEKSLDVSVPQIGAPSAWEAGFDGTGVRVAVLDTGVDADHPDLDGKVVAEANFSDAPTADDIDGHGTHVASTIAGSGAASDGQNRGVAPGAEILNGKVLDDFGGGSDSSVLAGMEWAVAQGADVINMSLGAGPTDGTDPLSMAVNELTESSGALFVIAAGNSGPVSVSTPGTADLALTVGAVDDGDQLADFSSTGPRSGDYAIKPEITAPGVDIDAAEAGGSGYVELSGTSMATPHIAGAAAILAQANPEWAAGELKAALVSSARPNPDLTVYQQGGGRVDIMAALSADLLVSEATLDLGYFPYSEEEAQPSTQTLTYTNLSDQDIQVDLTVTVTSDDGEAAPEGMVTLSGSTLSITANGTASVEVTIDPRAGDFGLYGGRIVATTADGATVGTPVGFFKEPVRHTVTIEGIERDGTAGLADFAAVALVNAERGEDSRFAFVGGEDSAEFRVAPGTYSATAMTLYADAYVLLADLEVRVDGDMSITLDARDAVPVEVTVPERGTATAQMVAYELESADGSALSDGVFAGSGTPILVTPTDEIGMGRFDMMVRAIHQTGPRRLWDTVFVEEGSVPDDLSYEANREDMAIVTQRFHANQPDTEYVGSTMMTVPEIGTSFGVFDTVRAPTTRTEFVSAGVQREQQWWIEAGEFGEAVLYEDETYEPGERARVSWFKQVSAPTPGDSFRVDDTLVTVIPEFGDAAGHAGFAGSVDTVSLRLYQGRSLRGEADTGLFAELPLSAGPGRYRLVMEADRDAEWWTMSTRTRTEWWFTSERGEDFAPVGLLGLGYDLPLDGLNRASDRPIRMGLTIEDPTGNLTAPIERARVWTSTNDGRSWIEVTNVRQTGDHTFSVRLPAADGPVSLKVVAFDEDGNRVSQEVIRAYDVK